MPDLERKKFVYRTPQEQVALPGDSIEAWAEYFDPIFRASFQEQPFSRRDGNFERVIPNEVLNVVDQHMSLYPFLGIASLTLAAHEREEDYAFYLGAVFLTLVGRDKGREEYARTIVFTDDEITQVESMYQQSRGVVSGIEEKIRLVSEQASQEDLTGLAYNDYAGYMQLIKRTLEILKTARVGENIRFLFRAQDATFVSHITAMEAQMRVIAVAETPESVAQAINDQVTLLRAEPVFPDRASSWTRQRNLEICHLSMEDMLSWSVDELDDYRGNTATWYLVSLMQNISPQHPAHTIMKSFFLSVDPLQTEGFDDNADFYELVKKWRVWLAGYFVHRPDEGLPRSVRALLYTVFQVDNRYLEYLGRSLFYSAFKESEDTRKDVIGQSDSGGVLLKVDDLVENPFLAAIEVELRKKMEGKGSEDEFVPVDAVVYEQIRLRYAQLLAGRESEGKNEVKDALGLMFASLAEIPDIDTVLSERVAGVVKAHLGSFYKHLSERTEQMGQLVDGIRAILIGQGLIDSRTQKIVLPMEGGISRIDFSPQLARKEKSMAVLMGVEKVDIIYRHNRFHVIIYFASDKKTVAYLKVNEMGETVPSLQSLSEAEPVLCQALDAFAYSCVHQLIVRRVVYHEKGQGRRGRSAGKGRQRSQTKDGSGPLEVMRRRLPMSVSGWQDDGTEIEVTELDIDELQEDITGKTISQVGMYTRFLPGGRVCEEAYADYREAVQDGSVARIEPAEATLCKAIDAMKQRISPDKAGTVPQALWSEMSHVYDPRDPQGAPISLRTWVVGYRKPPLSEDEKAAGISKIIATRYQGAALPLLDLVLLEQ
jgi:hypothetical protein